MPITEGITTSQREAGAERQTKVRWRRVGAVALSAAVTLGASAGWVHNHLQPSEAQQQIERIIDTPTAIPEGHARTVIASSGEGTADVAQKYAAEGEYDHLKAELDHEAEPDGGLRAGTYTIYDGFIDRQFTDPQNEQALPLANSGQQQQ